jgi:hypothetical protein
MAPLKFSQHRRAHPRCAAAANRPWRRLIAGERAQMSEADSKALRNSGCFTCCGIRCMALMGGFVFWLIRFALALVPPLALHCPAKKGRRRRNRHRADLLPDLACNAALRSFMRSPCCSWP